MNVSQSEGFTDARRELRLVDQGGNGPANQVPLVGEPEGNHRLNVENVLHVVVRPHPEVDIVLERHRNEIRDGVLGLLGQVGVVLGRYRSGQHQQQEQRGADRPAHTRRCPRGRARHLSVTEVGPGVGGHATQCVVVIPGLILERPAAADDRDGRGSTRGAPEPCRPAAPGAEKGRGSARAVAAAGPAGTRSGRASSCPAASWASCRCAARCGRRHQRTVMSIASGPCSLEPGMLRAW